MLLLHSANNNWAWHVKYPTTRYQPRTWKQLSIRLDSVATQPSVLFDISGTGISRYHSKPSIGPGFLTVSLFPADRETDFARGPMRGWESLDGGVIAKLVRSVSLSNVKSGPGRVVLSGAAE